jgi:leader peptidase (prepilin peptidase)/N-methyltransferase
VTGALVEFSWIFAAGLGVLGLIVGSFLNVVIARVPHQQSIVRPSSRCPLCGHSLPWYENIPVFSWLLLGGRCSACRGSISWRYPAVELLTAVLFLACLRRYDWSWELVLALMLVTLLIPLTFIDLERWILPFALTIPGTAFGLMLSFPLGITRVAGSVLGAVIGFLGFWAMEWLGEKWFRKEALGGGDKYLLAMLGAFLTYKALLGVVFLASFQGALVGGVLLLLTGRAGPAPGKNPESQPEVTSQKSEGAHSAPAAITTGEDDWKPGPHNIPFGPWLSLAAVEVMLLQPWFARALPMVVSKWLVGD